MTGIKSFRKMTWLSTVFFLWVCWSGVSRPAGPGDALAEEPGGTVSKAEGTQKDDYLIGAGDVLEIVVWREPDISRTVRVRPDGKISLPLVDEVQAAGGTLPDLKKEITKAVAKFVDGPSVYVMLQENRSKRFHVVGKVNQPGQYILESDTTVLQGIAMAAGLTEWAKSNDIGIIRRGPEGHVRMKFEYNDVVSGKNLKQNVFLHPEDVIVVP